MEESEQDGGLIHALVHAANATAAGASQAKARTRGLGGAEQPGPGALRGAEQPGPRALMGSLHGW